MGRPQTFLYHPPLAQRGQAALHNELILYQVRSRTYMGFLQYDRSCFTPHILRASSNAGGQNSRDQGEVWYDLAWHVLFTRVFFEECLRGPLYSLVIRDARWTLAVPPGSMQSCRGFDQSATR